MSLQTTLSRNSLLQLLRDPQVRVGIYIWLVIAGLCVLVANTMPA